MKEGMEKSRNPIRRNRTDDLLKVVNGNLVGITVGELGEGGKDAALELNHGGVGGKGRVCGRSGGGGGGGGF